MKKAELKAWSLVTAYTKDSDVPLMTDDNVVSIDVHGSLSQVVNSIIGTVTNYIDANFVTTKQSLR